MFNTKARKPLTPLEQFLMDYVWAHPDCTAETCREGIARERALKDSTIRTILRNLEEKGYVTHKTAGRTFVYRPVGSRRNVAVEGAQKLIDRFCGGSVEDFLVGLVDHQVLQPKQLQRLMEKIAARKEGEVVMTVEFLAQWALRSSILIGTGAVLLKALRVKDPAVRLAAWTAMLVGSLAIPLLTASLPAVPVRTLPSAVSVIPVEHPAPAATIAVVRQETPAAPAPRRFDWASAAVGAYIFVAGLLLLRVGLGFAMSLRLLRASRATPDAGVRESERVTSPVTLGIVRPVILLPPDWRQWDSAKLAAVLAHERSHIQRRDPAVQALSAIHRALLWYSPLSWYLDRQIVRLAEQASDDAAVAATRDRVSYAETLLEFMQRGVGSASWQGVPMARYAHPEQRIHRILDATSLSRGVTRWTVAAILVLGLPLAYVIAAAQERLTFEAASVKAANPNLPDGHIVVGMQPPTGGPGTGDPSRIRYPIVSLKMLVARAYVSNSEKIVGPDWLDTDFFQVDATMPPETNEEQFREMLRNLLSDRFQLNVHRETKESRTYSLVVAKGGPKMKESVESGEPTTAQDAAREPSRARPQIAADGFPTHPNIPATGAGMFSTIGLKGVRFTARGQTMQDLAHALTALSSRPLSNDTGLTAKYDFTLTFSMPRPQAQPDGEALPDLFSALPSQLGLRLESKKGSMDLIVIDHIEKTPTGN